jgi:hypothetical protein
MYLDSESVDSWNSASSHQPSSNAVSPAMDFTSHYDLQYLSPLPVTETNLEEVQPYATEPEYLIEHMRSIDFESSHPVTPPAFSPSTYGAVIKPLTPFNVEFSPDDNSPLSSFLPQFVQYRDELRLSGLNDNVKGNAITPFGREESPAYYCAAFADDFHMRNDNLECPLSAGTSANGSGVGSPLTDNQQLEPR